ncbi:MAG: isoprenylcysteine carboxylmethyltransferase family protein [Planctomycetes bacterium]|nr:isoprenylcysteine carboxylmethyltransferase family protein [Planctomycetota bacterium]
MRRRRTGMRRVLYAVLLIGGRPIPSGMWAWLPALIVARAVAVWAHGHLRKVNARHGGDGLPTVSGPYAHTRNPYYLATWLGDGSLCAMAGLGWLALPYLAWQVAFSSARVREEERLLRTRLGGPYEDYLRAVPRWWPHRRAARLGGTRPFELSLVMRNGEPSRLASAAALALALWAKAVWLEGRVCWPHACAAAGAWILSACLARRRRAPLEPAGTAARMLAHEGA